MCLLQISSNFKIVTHTNTVSFHSVWPSFLAASVDSWPSVQHQVPFVVRAHKPSLLPYFSPICGTAHLVREKELCNIWTKWGQNTMTGIFLKDHFGGVVQERHNSSALAMELRLSCTNSSISNTFSGIKIIEFWFRFDWSLFPQAILQYITASIT